MRQNKTSTSLKKFAKNSFFFLSGTALSKAMSFFLIPLYSSVVPTDGMGEFDVSITIMYMLASFCYFEIWTGVLRKSYEKRTHDEKLEVIGGGLQVFFLSSLAFSVFCLLLCYAIGYRYKFWILIYMLSYMMSYFFSFSARSLGFNKMYAASGFLSTVLTIGSNLFFLLFLKFDFSALYISASIGFIGQTLFLLLGCHLFKPFANIFKFKKTNIDLVKFCLPLCANSIAYWCLTSLNRVVFNGIYGDSASGIFAMGSRFGTLVILITTCFNYAWQDLSFSEMSGGENDKKFFSKGCNVYMVFLFAGFSIFVPLLYFAAPFLLKGDYNESTKLIPLFILSSSLNAFTSFLSSTFYAIKETKGIAIATLVGMAVNIAICYPLIKLFGPNGVNLSSCVAFLVIIIVMTIILKKKIYFSLSPKVLLLFSAVSLLSFVSFSYFDWRANVLSLFTGVIATLYLIKDVLISKHP